MPPLAFLSFVLIAVSVSVMVDSKPRPSELDLQSGLTNPSLAQATISPIRSEWRTFMRRSNKWPDFLVILPVKTHSTNHIVSIFDLRRKRFLCLDLKGELFNSRHRNTKDCLFYQLWPDRANKRVFYSTRTAQILELQEAERNVMQKSLEEHVGFWHRFLRPLVKRQKRSEQINPSDPLRSETNPSHPANNHKETEQSTRDQAGAVSKETITSCDDPLKVLQTNGPGTILETKLKILN